MNRFTKHSKLFLSRNASTILTCIGGIGVVATTVLAVKATPKAVELLQQAEEEKNEPLTTIEKFKVAGPVYIPTIVTGVSTLACIFGANALNKRHQASLMSAYALLDRSFKDYKNKVTELYGKEAGAQVNQSIAKDKYEDCDIEVEDNKQLFYDMYSQRYFESTMEDVLKAEYNLNRELSFSCVATVNQFYEFLDIPPIEGGDVLGWSSDSNFEAYWQTWIDFYHEKTVMDDGLECYIITMFCEPSMSYYDY